MWKRSGEAEMSWRRWFVIGKKKVNCTKCGLEQYINIYSIPKPCPKCKNRLFESPR